MNPEIEIILSYLTEKRGVDFSGNRPALIERRINTRLTATKTVDFHDYRDYLTTHPKELDSLIDVLTITVSRFFRNTLTFEYIADRVLPAIIHQEAKTLDPSLRVWSAGCSTGEEPYSIAILINELMRKEHVPLHLNIFATDIDKKALKKAQAGVYPFENIKGIKYHLLKKYFTITNDAYSLNAEIKELISFYVYDMLDKKTYVPSESVFGNFDLVLCRNVLIYFQTEYQDLIFKKLYRSLSKQGYLVLGEAETLPPKYRRYFKKENDYCRVYRKYR